MLSSTMTPTRRLTWSERLALAHDRMNNPPQEQHKTQENKLKSAEKLDFPEQDCKEFPKIGAKLLLNGEIVSSVVADLTALIVSPAGRILYLEAATTSDSMAHALMGMVSDGRGSTEWRFYPAGTDLNASQVSCSELDGPPVAHCQDVRLQVPSYRGHVHHLAILDKSGELILSRNDEALWAKLRQRLTCPTLPEWGAALLPRLMAHTKRVLDGLGIEGAEVILEECQQFGMDDGMKAYVLGSDADAKFDAVVGQYICEIGGLPRESR